MFRSVSPLRYPGGKSQFYNQTKEIIESNNLTNFTYIEPFAGGAGVALRLLFEHKVKRIVLNDYDPAIYAFWYSVLNYNDEFIELIKKTPININEWHNQKNNYKQRDNVLSLGFATFYLNRCNRSGIILSNPIGGIQQTGNYKIDCRFNKDDLIKKIKKIYEYRKQIEVYNLDAEEFIKTHYKLRKSFWFIDPPYYHQGSNLYSNYYKYENHLSLKNTIFQFLDNKKWILTYDKCEEIKKIYKCKRKIIIKLNYSVGTKKKAEEYLFFKNVVIKM